MTTNSVSPGSPGREEIRHSGRITAPAGREKARRLGSFLHQMCRKDLRLDESASEVGEGLDCFVVQLRRVED
jgi:hypothetical protein